jgi:hypothetical protein
VISIVAYVLLLAVILLIADHQASTETFAQLFQQSLKPAIYFLFVAAIFVNTSAFLAVLASTILISATGLIRSL